MKKKITYLINIFFMIAILVITFYLLQKDQDMELIVKELRTVKLFSIVLAVCCAVAYLVLQGISLQIILASLRAPIRLLPSIRYSFIGFLFNAITPSASGGQPMQVLYMRQDGISLGASTVSLLFWTILYKVALLLIEGYIFLFHREFAISCLGGYFWLFLLGISVNLISIILYSLIVFSKKGVQYLANWVTWICQKIRFIKNRDRIKNRMDVMVEHYQEGASYMRTHWKVTAVVLAITIVQRLSYFLITWFVYQSFGLAECSIIEIIILQSFVSVCIDMLPMPGGVGLNESFFVSIFQQVMGQQLAFSAMLLSRGASFYVLLIMSAFVTMGTQIRIIKKQKQKS